MFVGELWQFQIRSLDYGMIFKLGILQVTCLCFHSFPMPIRSPTSHDLKEGRRKKLRILLKGRADLSLHK